MNHNIIKVGSLGKWERNALYVIQGENEGQSGTVQSNNFIKMLFGSNNCKLSPEISLSYMYT